MAASAPLPDGRRADAYRYTAGLSRRDWAWEFVRRNPAFRTALSRFSQHVTSRRVALNVTVYRLQREAPSLADWGVVFRDLCR